jgi:hypothetical protein
MIFDRRGNVSNAFEYATANRKFFPPGASPGRVLPRICGRYWD